MAVKKTKLQLTDSARETIVLGLVSVEMDHKLVWQLNNKLMLNFQQADMDPGIDFPSYSCQDDWDNEFLLMINKRSDGIRFPSLKNLDFIVKICYDNMTFDLQKFKDNLKTLSGISAVISIDEKNQKLIKDLC